MADSTSPNHAAATRWLETSHGILSYTQFAPLLAERVLRVQQRIEVGEFAALVLNEHLLCFLHGAFCGDLTPEFAGKWRTINVVVGTHQPPPPYAVPLRIRDYTLDLGARLDAMHQDEDLPDVLAFAEGRLLTIHPFADFNGRLTRLWLWELLRRLRLPPVALVPSGEEGTMVYLQALRAADASDFSPLAMIWRERLGTTIPEQ